MRLAMMTLLGTLGLAAGTASAPAAPLVPYFVAPAPAIVAARWGCGWGFHPVPGHWNRWRGWVPPHCAPNMGPYGPPPYWHPHWRPY